LQCKASGNPPPKVYWLKDMKKVEVSSRHTIIDGLYLQLGAIIFRIEFDFINFQPPGSLQITQSEEDDQARYVLCKVANIQEEMLLIFFLKIVSRLDMNV
jgi:hypothetical protein